MYIQTKEIASNEDKNVFPKPNDGKEKTNNYLSEIKALKEKIASLRPLTEGEKEELYKEFVTDYVYNSEAIEGNSLTLRETDRVLKGIAISKKPLKDHLNAIEHKDAFHWITSLAETKTPLSESLIKEVHSCLLGIRREDRGVYRTEPVRILGALSKPAEPSMIQDQMKELFDWYRKVPSEDFLSKLALFHLWFESIHPFPDGNGRTGRLILNLELRKLRYLPINIKFTDRKAYYNAFDSYAVTGSIEARTEFFAYNLIESRKTYISILEPNI